MQEIFANQDGKEAFKDFLQLARNSTSDKPDYYAFRNILNIELEKCKHNPNYNKFEWQN